MTLAGDTILGFRGVAGTIDARCTAQGLYLQAGVVSKAVDVVFLRHVLSLQQGIVL